LSAFDIEVPDGTIVGEVGGAGEPVVLLHAGVADRRMWNRVAPLLECGRSVVRLDLRGFGGSSVPRADFRHADDLLAVLDGLVLDRVHLVAASFGGSVALAFAASHPARVRSLVLLASPLPGHDWSDRMREYFDAEEEAIERGNLDAAVELNLQMWVRGSRDWSDETRAIAADLREQLRIALTNQPAGDQFDLGAESPVRDLLERLDVPAHVVVGLDDVPDFVMIAEELAARLPRARLTRLPGVGHLIAMERPDETAALVADFVAEHTAPG